MSLADLCRALGLGPDPQAVLQPLEALYRELDEALAAASQGLGLPCKSGCDACCHEAVFVSAPEVLAVGAALLAGPAALRHRVVDEMLLLAERFEDELLLLETITPGPERDEVAARVKFRCPLLGPGGACGVYGARELNARTFGQTVDEARGAPYGCGLTHARLAVLPDALPRLPGARAARQGLVARVPGAGFVHVYPWWFARHAAELRG
jgi:Fe-S-cluster containining protein